MGVNELFNNLSTERRGAQPGSARAIWTDFKAALPPRWTGLTDGILRLNYNKFLKIIGMTYCSWDVSDWDKYSAVQTVVDIRKAKTFLDLHGEKYAKFLWVKAHKKISAYTRFIQFQIPRSIKTKFFLTNLPWNLFNEIYIEKADEFFEKRAQKVLPKSGVDVVLIDGDHSYEQTLKDVNNCLRYLKDDGVIVMHDCSPSCEISATPSQDIQTATQLLRDRPEWTGEWSGDTWRAIVHLRSTRKDLHIFVLNCDCGLGIITKGKPENMLEFSEEEIMKLTYQDLDRDRVKMLNLKDQSYLAQFL